VALAVDATSHSTAQSGSSWSWNHTCTGSNLILVVGVTNVGAGNSVLTLTYNSVSLTQVRKDFNGSSNSTTEIWYLLNPATGTHSIAVALNGNATSGIGCAISLTGAAQSGQMDANVGDSTGSGSPISDNITTLTAGDYVIDLACDNPTGAMGAATAGGSQTVIANIADSSIGVLHMASYKGPVSPAGAATMSWTDTSSGPSWSHSLVAVKPAASTFTWQQLTPEGQELPREYFDRVEVVDY